MHKHVSDTTVEKGNLIGKGSFFNPAPTIIQRKRIYNDNEIHQKEADDSIISNNRIDNYIKELPSKGHLLTNDTKSFFEPKFGYNFNNIRIHTDAEAAKSAQSINALAYTSGNNIVFNDNFNPHTHEGKKLLAHELTHTIQQQSSENSIMRFSDTGHHVIEEAALSAFTEEQRKKIEEGNISRDYSQVGTAGNFALLCDARTFGGYKKEEHFDNFMWDVLEKRWRTRGPSPFSNEGTPVDSGDTPIGYIYSELESLIDLGLDPKKGGLVHLGNAFHTIEDFFAHSNFVELINNDNRFGSTLLTGDFAKADESVSLSHVFEGVSTRLMKEYYTLQADKILPQTNILSHSRIAHDTPDKPNYTLARRLAALVIQQLSSLILEVFTHPEYERDLIMREKVFSRITRYLRPPSKDDQWWVTLQADDMGKIDKRLEEAERKTKVTVNQCVVSPLKNVEASTDSSMHIPLGLAVPFTFFGNQMFFQAGPGTVTFTDPRAATDDKAGNINMTRGDSRLMLFGAQVTATFDFF